MFTVYALFSDRCDRLYIGYTSNFEVRMASHNDFGRGFTSRCRPWRCFYEEQFDDKAMAMKRDLLNQSLINVQQSPRIFHLRMALSKFLKIGFWI